MTTDDFTQAARAEVRRMAWKYNVGPEPYDQDIREAYRDGGEHMAEWARTHLAAQEPTDAEIAEADTLDPTINTTQGTDTPRGGYLLPGSFTHWLAYGETGMSSEAIMRAALGADIRKDAWTHPSDPGDFRRCVLLLDAVPEARRYMDALADASAVWAALIANWDDIEKTLAEEVPGFRERDPRGRAPKTYRLIQSLSDQARKPDAATIRREVLGR